MLHWHELHGIGTSVVVPFLLVDLTIGLVLHFSMGFFEALPYLFYMSGDSVGPHMGAHSQKIEIHWEAWAPPNHQVV